MAPKAPPNVPGVWSALRESFEAPMVKKRPASNLEPNQQSQGEPPKKKPAANQSPEEEEEDESKRSKTKSMRFPGALPRSLQPHRPFVRKISATQLPTNLDCLGLHGPAKACSQHPLLVRFTQALERKELPQDVFDTYNSLRSRSDKTSFINSILQKDCAFYGEKKEQAKKMQNPI